MLRNFFPMVTFSPVLIPTISKRWFLGRVLVAHACNPSNSGDKDQEDRGSKPAWANSLQDPISKKTLHKKVLWV
jgi:hypothetical protein